MKIYTGTFVKKDGKTRKMLFAKIKDLPGGFLPEGKGGQGTKLPEGMELVWETKAQVIEKDLVPLLKNNPEFTKDYLEHKWEVRIDDGGAVRIEV